MEQHNQEIGTRRDLVLYRLETARNDLKSARALFSIEDYKGGEQNSSRGIFGRNRRMCFDEFQPNRRTFLI